jgi:hypothetical protein
MTKRKKVVFGLLRRMAILTACAMLGIPVYAFSDERCEFGDVIGALLVRPGEQAGEFRIQLSPPDYQSPEAIQHHLSFSTIWARTLSTELSTTTGGLCSVIITPFFPDLRVYLISNLSRGGSGQDASTCRRSLEGLISSPPKPESVQNAVVSEAQELSQRALNPAGYMSAASNVLMIALGRIYQTGSLMHTLVSFDAVARQALDAQGLFGWLQKQHSASPINLVPLIICSGELNQSSPQVERRADALPRSDIVASAPIVLSEQTVGRASASFLRYAVIVGDDQAVVNARGESTATTKYCNKEYEFTDNRGSSSILVKVQCLRAALYSVDGWTVFFCDSSQCKTDQIAENVARTIAGDDDVVAMATFRAASAKRRGPYLVEIERASK